MFIADPLQGRINVFYSTPNMYTNAKHEANVTWTTKVCTGSIDRFYDMSVKEDDFFPIAKHPHEIWAGFFTSRPALKGYIRTTSAYLQACRQMEIQVPPTTNASSFLLWEV